MQNQSTFPGDSCGDTELSTQHRVYWVSGTDNLWIWTPERWHTSIWQTISPFQALGGIDITSLSVARSSTLNPLRSKYNGVQKNRDRSSPRSLVATFGLGTAAMLLDDIEQPKQLDTTRECTTANNGSLVLSMMTHLPHAVHTLAF